MVNLLLWYHCSPLPEPCVPGHDHGRPERHVRRCRRRLRRVRNADACGAGRLLQAAITGCQKQRGGESLARTRVGDPARPGPQALRLASEFAHRSYEIPCSCLSRRESTNRRPRGTEGEREGGEPHRGSRGPPVLPPSRQAIPPPPPRTAPRGAPTTSGRNEWTAEGTSPLARSQPQQRIRLARCRKLSCSVRRGAGS